MRFLRTPYGAMTIVVMMYVMKVATKLGFGHAVNSPMIIGDGWHNVSDIFEATLVMFMVWVSRLPRSEKYPFGRKNVESIVTFAIGAALCVLAAKLAFEAAFGLAGWVPAFRETVERITPFHREPLRIEGVGTAWFWLALAVTGGNGLLSLAVSAYQVRVGKREGHEALVSDGIETKSDAYIEFVTAAGVLSEYLLHQPRLEFAFTLAVAVKLAWTGRELVLTGYRALLQRALPAELEDEIRTETMRMCGVEKVAELKTFRSGSVAIVIMKVHTWANLASARVMKRALVRRVVALARKNELSGCDLYVRFDLPSLEWHRVAYAIGDGDRERIASTIAEADRIRICDVANGELERARDMPARLEIQSVIGALKRKKVTKLFVHGKGNEAERDACARVDIAYTVVEHDDPRVYGCDPDIEEQ